MPPKEDLPRNAVRRAHGKGAVEEGIFDHPIVVISRPAEKSNIVHFHLISSLQGRRLEDLYPKSNEFHASRRAWYLPIFPAPDHPDAVSKKTKKRFPTLKLADEEVLRWDSYVIIRNVYKIDLSLLRPYTNPEMPAAKGFRFERESTIRMLAKGKTLTLYEPDPQYISLSLRRTASDPTPTSEVSMSRTHEKEHKCQPTPPLADMVAAMATMAASIPAQPDFRLDILSIDRIAGPLPKVPPDGNKVPVLPSLEPFVVPWERFCGEIQSAAMLAQQGLASLPRNGVTFGGVHTQLWRDVKGVTAVLIASI